MVCAVFPKKNRFTKTDHCFALKKCFKSGSPPQTPLRELTARSPDPLAALRGPTSKGRGGDETPSLHAPQVIFLDTPLTSQLLHCDKVQCNCLSHSGGKYCPPGGGGRTCSVCGPRARRPKHADLKHFFQRETVVCFCKFENFSLKI